MAAEGGGRGGGTPGGGSKAVPTADGRGKGRARARAARGGGWAPELFEKARALLDGEHSLVGYVGGEVDVRGGVQEAGLGGRLRLRLLALLLSLLHRRRRRRRLRFPVRAEMADGLDGGADQIYCLHVTDGLTRQFQFLDVGDSFLCDLGGATSRTEDSQSCLVHDQNFPSRFWFDLLDGTNYSFASYITQPAFHHVEFVSVISNGWIQK
jgi:hypothetical protein